ncbi:hypothetical protein GCM10023085_21430 [Actinomadura viridis]|uniref:HD domain-containing protein n=1 Tax=Actinomadura viridis TaxID=58110 RepID=A0A931GQG9_9ACTN|nr:HD domain-containing protein [Actinomadura viridis]MBG6088519.1 hypothetical protein [Actinomadura viridis]
MHGLPPREPSMSRLVAEFSVPDTELTREAYAFAAGLEPVAMLNHSVRSYLFGRAAGEGSGLRPGADYDDELLFLAAVLHDVGLTGRGDGHQRFEVDGADLAAGFLRERGLSEERVEIVWTSIALHTSAGIADRMRPEIALISTGTGIDVAGREAGRLPGGLADRVHEALPRLADGGGVLEVIIEQAVRDPAKAPLGSLAFELARQSAPGTPVPDWRALVAGAWAGVA